MYSNVFRSSKVKLTLGTQEMYSNVCFLVWKTKASAFSQKAIKIDHTYPVFFMPLPHSERMATQKNP